MRTAKICTAIGPTELDRVAELPPLPPGRDYMAKFNDVDDCWEVWEVEVVTARRVAYRTLDEDWTMEPGIIP